MAAIQTTWNSQKTQYLHSWLIPTWILREWLFGLKALLS